MSTPAELGYAQCTRCKSWRAALDKDGKCAEVAYCSEEAGVGKGQLDADTGKPLAPRVAPREVVP